QGGVLLVGQLDRALEATQPVGRSADVAVADAEVEVRIGRSRKLVDVELEQRDRVLGPSCGAEIVCDAAQELIVETLRRIEASELAIGFNQTRRAARLQRRVEAPTDVGEDDAADRIDDERG